jgi:hypothetical protein
MDFYFNTSKFFAHGPKKRAMLTNLSALAVVISTVSYFMHRAQWDLVVELDALTHLTRKAEFCEKDLRLW